MGAYRIRIDAYARSITVKITGGEAAWAKPTGKTVEIKTEDNAPITAFSFDDQTVTYSSTERIKTHTTVWVQTSRDMEHLPINVSHTGEEFYIESDVQRLGPLVKEANDYSLL